MAEDWPILPTGDGKTVKLHDPEHWILENIRMATPMLYGFHHYEYGTDGSLCRRPMADIDVYKDMYCKAVELLPWAGKLRNTLNDQFVCSFLFSAQSCGTYQDPRVIFTVERIQFAFESARKLRGKKDLKQGLGALRDLCMTLRG